MAERLLLHDDNAEKYVIGGMLNSQELFYSISDRLKPQLFYNSKYARIAKCIIEVYKEGKTADLITVADYITSHPDANNPDLYELSCLLEFCIVGGFAEHFNIIEGLYQRRRYFELGTKLMEFGTNPIISEEEVKKDINNVLTEDIDKRKRVKSLRDANKELKTRVLDNYNGTSKTMIPTGIKEIDDKGGLQTGDFDVIAAESSIGKTSLATCMMVNAGKAGVPSMMFSMEMQSAQIAARIVAPYAKLSSGIIQYKKLDDWQMNELSQALKNTDELPIYFDDESTVSFDSIIASIRANVKNLGIKLVVIDYLQILASTGNITNQEQFLGAVCRKLKNLAKELDICIIALSQLARNINDPKPTGNRLRASGQIRESADDVILIWRPSVYGKGYDQWDVDNIGNTAELIFDKARGKGTFSCIVGFDQQTTLFYNYEGVVKKLGEIKINNNNMKKVTKEDDPLPEPVQGSLPF